MSSTPRRGAYAVTVILAAAMYPSLLPGCTDTANIADVYTALDGQGDRKRNVFFTDSKELHCIVEMGIGRRGVTIEVLFRQLQTYDFVADKFFETDRVLASAENNPQPADGIQQYDVSLLPSDPEGKTADGAPFPPGRYVCEARLDGVLEKTAVFNIMFPPCPDATILTGTLCYGFYKKDLQCARYGLTSRDPAQCTCSQTKGWQC